MDIYDKILSAYYFNGINQTEIAAFIGCAPETFQRGFKKKQLSKKHLEKTLEFFKNREIDIHHGEAELIPPEIDYKELLEENQSLKNEILSLYRKLQNTQVATVVPELKKEHKVAIGKR